MLSITGITTTSQRQHSGRFFKPLKQIFKLNNYRI